MNSSVACHLHNPIEVIMDYDQVLEHVGQFGLWQIMVCLLASLAAMAEAFMTLQVSILTTRNTRTKSRLKSRNKSKGKHVCL